MSPAEGFDPAKSEPSGSSSEVESATPVGTAEATGSGTAQESQEPEESKAEKTTPGKKSKKPAGISDLEMGYDHFKEAFKPKPNPRLGHQGDHSPKADGILFASIGPEAKEAKGMAGDQLEYLWTQAYNPSTGQRFLRPGLYSGALKEGLVVTEVPWQSSDQIVHLT